MTKIGIILRRFITWFLYRIIGKPVIAARFLGVQIGKNCKILDDPWKVFGSEPYLIRIGNHVEITNGVRFVTHDGSIWVKREEKEFENADIFGPIKISNNVFIGINSIILPGANIECNVIIGAGSVVKGSISSNSIVGGIPAKKIKTVDEYLAQKKGIIQNTHNMKLKEKRNFLLENYKNELDV